MGDIAPNAPGKFKDGEAWENVENEVHPFLTGIRTTVYLLLVLTAIISQMASDNCIVLKLWD